MRRLKNRGQSVLEYVLVWTAVVGAVIMAIGIIRGKIVEGMGSKSGGMTDRIGKEYGNFSSKLMYTTK